MRTTIGKRLKELREQQRLTQEELAQYLNVSRQAISQWENDKVYPDISNIALLCQLYKISSDELLGIETQQINKKEKRIGEKIEWIIMILVLLGVSQFNLAGIPIAIGIALRTNLSKSKHKFIYVLCFLCIVANLLKSGYRNPTGFRRWVKVAKSIGLCYIYGMGTWKAKNRHKYLLQYHIIFVCKYRKKLLVSKQISDDTKQFSYEICQRHKVVIKYMETDKDHIHYMIETEPTMSVSKIVNLMKSYTPYHIWERYPNYLRKHFWKEHTFWTDGYFACSVGNVSEEMLRKYIENQG